MHIDHLALLVRDLEIEKQFYKRYFLAREGVPYHNPQTGLRSCFLRLEQGPRLELMSRPETVAGPGQPCFGYAHLALSLGSREAVNALTARLAADGVPVLSGPRTTGDGYYESCVQDPEGNQIELTV